jgi:hypothetical protein
MIRRDRRRDVLQQHRLAGLRRRDDEAALALADRRDHVDDARREIFRAAVALLELEPLLREQWREILEEHLALRGLRGVVVDLADLEQREVALAVLRRADQARYRVARAEIEPADLARAHVDVVGAREIRAVGGAQEAEAVLQDLEHALAEDVFAVLRVRLENRKDDVLFAGPGEVFEPHGLGELHERGGWPRLELGEIHCVLRRLELRGRYDVELLVVRKLLAHRPAATATVAAIALTVAVPLVRAAVFHPRTRGIA